jgi:hypothetical protein
MPRKAGKKADGKGSAKAGYLMGGSKRPGSAAGGHPPKGMAGMMKSGKSGT